THLMLGTTSEDTRILSQNLFGFNFTNLATPSFETIEQINKQLTDNTTRKRLVGAYGEFGLSYKEIAYLTLTGRNDWTSTLPIDNRSYFYPSISGSFIFSQLLPQSNIFSFGKVRGSWAQVGKDA